MTVDPEMMEKAKKMAAEGFRIPSIAAATGLSESWIRQNTDAKMGTPHGGSRRGRERRFMKKYLYR